MNEQSEKIERWVGEMKPRLQQLLPALDIIGNEARAGGRFTCPGCGGMLLWHADAVSPRIGLLCMENRCIEEYFD